jgi:hypothetical protein
MSKFIDPKSMPLLFLDAYDVAKEYGRLDAHTDAEVASLNSTSNIIAQYKFDKFVTVEVQKTTKVVDYKP